jgi:hypothetical protein
MRNPQKLLKDVLSKAKEIHTDAYPMSIGELMSLYRDKELDIHPEFQRFFRWSDLQKSRFIESILLGIPIPSIFVAQRDDGVWDVVDGVQRLSTIFEFTGILTNDAEKPYPPLSLIGTDYLPNLDGMVWQTNGEPDCTFPNPLRLDFKRAKLDLKIIKKESDESTKYDLFERLNTLGSRLSDQELRNCLLVMINPEFFHWLENLSTFEAFREAVSLTDRAVQERYDMELVLRFLLLARAELTTVQNIRDVDAFITKGMRDLAADRTFNQDVERDTFQKTFSILLDAIGPDCFTRPGGGRGRGGFLISVFEVVAAGLGWRIRSKPSKTPRPAQVKAAYDSVGKNAEFKEYSKSGKSASSRMPKLVPLGRNLFRSV